jgi:hypothetical protein
LNKINILEGIIANALGQLIVVGLLGLIGFLSYRNWNKITLFFKKQKLKLFPVDFNLALSLDFIDGLNSGNYYQQIKKNLHQLIDDSGLSNQIVLREISDIKKFKNRKEAELFRAQKNIDLIIWGDFTNDHLQKDGERLNEAHLKFTFGHPKDKQNMLGKMLLFDINSVIAQKNYWTIFEKNSFEDVKIISDNIFDIATYILALTLKLYGKITNSLVLFEQLQRRLEIKKNGNKIIYEKILLNLYNCYELLIIEHGIYKKNHLISAKYCSKILAINKFKNDFFAMANLAIAQYCLGDTTHAELYVNKLESLYPDNPITLLDVAYFRILQKKYKIAYQKYKKLTKFNAVEFNPEEVIEFLGKEYYKIKEPALLYGSGIIANRWSDKNLAKKHLTFFLKKAKSNEYRLMRKESKKILKHLKNFTTDSLN